MVVARDCEERRMGSYLLPSIKFHLFKMIRVLEMNGDDGYITI